MTTINKEAQIETRKQIAFDMLVNELRKEFGFFKYTRGYSKIRIFLKNRGYEHTQGSVYTSKNPESFAKTLKNLLDLRSQYKWIKKGSRKIHISEVPEIYEVTEFIIR